MRDEKTALSYWFPIIQAAGLPVPKTEIVVATPDEVRQLVETFDEGTAEPEDLYRRIGCAAERVVGIGRPFFLRTDFTSGKHSWADTCFVADHERVGRHVLNLVEFSLCVDFMGLDFSTWVVRELLQPQAVACHAFRGMPIAREFRYFVRDDAIEHRQPYWPMESLEGSVAMPDRESWEEDLATISVLSEQERHFLDVLARGAGRALGGYWSVDFYETRDRGWMITDMAEGEKSYRWSPEIPL